MRSANRTLWLLLAGVGLLLSAVGAGAGDSPATAPAASQAASRATSGPQMVVYRSVAPKGPGNVDAYAKWIGHPDVWAEDFTACDCWDNVRNPGWLLKPWSAWVAARTGRKMLLSIPMLVGQWDRSGPRRGIDANKPVSFADGAKGDYNDHYRVLAENLVQRALADKCIIRLGWEFNGGWYVWRVSKTETQDFCEYWRQIVKTMRSVAGAEKLPFCWNPNLGWMPYAKSDVWPGGEFVDFIGLDVYDQSWAKDTYPFPDGASEDEIARRQKRVWDEVIEGGKDGLTSWVKFAAEQKKPLAVPEWGVFQRPDKHGGLDNPLFIEQMHKFIFDPASNAAFHCYFDVEAGDGQHQLSPGLDGQHVTLFPKSAAKFKELFAGPLADSRPAN